MGPSPSLGAGIRAAVLAIAAASAIAAAPRPDPLAAARRFYNQGRYDQAFDAAKQAASGPATMSSARLIMGRARLERFRQNTVARELGPPAISIAHGPRPRPAGSAPRSAAIAAPGCAPISTGW